MGDSPRSTSSYQNKIPDEDVQAIYNYVCGSPANAVKPEIDFWVIPLESYGHKYAPPSLLFPEGLYMLIRGQRDKGARKVHPPHIPPHLHSMLFGHNLPENAAMEWVCSGPQFPRPTGIQQRYCYPRPATEKKRKSSSNPKTPSMITDAYDYMPCKAASLYTMFDHSYTEENLEHRLLHVYYSTKRASVLSPPRKSLAFLIDLTSSPMAIPTSPMTTTLQQQFTAVDHFWNQPLLSLDASEHTESPHLFEFQDTLSHISHDLHQQVLQADTEDEQAVMMREICSWAEQLAQDPMGMEGLYQEEV